MTSGAPEVPGEARRHRWRWLLIGVLLGVIVWWQGVTVLRVSGGSMSPEFIDGTAVIVLRPALDRLIRKGGYRPGDVVVAQLPGGLSLKRVVAVGPATVELTGGSLSVDGAVVPAPHPERAGAATVPAVEVPEDQLYLLGDDRRPLASRDSRDFGPVPAEAVRGRVVAAL